MSDPFADESSHEMDSAGRSGEGGSITGRPDDLPAVEAPSAGFFVQLFLVPALIVLAVVGVTALFGKLAEGEQDWRALVAEVRHPNEHRRWRAANGLAHLLRVDERLGARGQQLARNPEIAGTLSEMLQEELQNRSQRDEDLKQKVFLSLTLGRIDVPEMVLPVLQDAMLPDQDRDVRKSAAQSVIMIAGRLAERGAPLDNAGMIASLIALSSEPDPLFRQLGAYALGLVPGQAARDRLSVMLEDADEKARVDAAIGLTRHDSTAGLPVFRDILSKAATPFDPDDVEGQSTAQKRENAQQRIFEDFYVLKNTLKAVSTLNSRLDSSQRSDLVRLITPVAENNRHTELRLLARETLVAVSEGD